MKSIELQAIFGVCCLLYKFHIVETETNKGLFPKSRLFAISNTKNNYESSEKQCTENGGRLAVIADEKTNQFLLEFTLKKGAIFEWIGLQYNFGIYKWSDNVTVNQTFVSEQQQHSEINQTQHHRCFGLKEHKKTGGSCIAMWKDCHCFEHKYHICEFASSQGHNCSTWIKKIPQDQYQDPKLCLTAEGGNLQEVLIRDFSTCDSRICPNPENRTQFLSCEIVGNCSRLYVKSEYWITPNCPRRSIYLAQKNAPGKRIQVLHHTMFGDRPRCVKIRRKRSKITEYCGGSEYSYTNCSNLYICQKPVNISRIKMSCVSRKQDTNEYKVGSCLASNKTTETTLSATETTPTTTLTTTETNLSTTPTTLPETETTLPETETTLRKTETTLPETQTTLPKTTLREKETTIPETETTLPKTTLPETETTQPLLESTQTTAETYTEEEFGKTLSTGSYTTTDAETDVTRIPVTPASTQTSGDINEVIRKNSKTGSIQQQHENLHRFDKQLETCSQEPLSNFCLKDNIKLVDFEPNKKRADELVKIGPIKVLNINPEGGATLHIVAAETKPSEELLESFVDVDELDNTKESNGHKSNKIPIQTLLHLQVFDKRGKTPSGVGYQIQLSASNLNINKITQPDSGIGHIQLSEASVKCVYLDTKTNLFSDYGMESVEPKSPNYKCQSNHTTVFAVMLSVQSVAIPNGVQTVSYVTESISIFFLLLTLAILLVVRKKIRSDRPFVQINLTISLILLNFFNLVQEAALKNNRACEVDAVFIHLFLLSSVFWMLLEGVTLVMKTMDNALHYGNSKKMVALRLGIGWGIPLLITLTAVTVAFPMDNYMSLNPALLTSALPTIKKYSKCWLSTKSGVLLGSVIVPIAIALLLNVIILIRVATFVFLMSKQTDNFKPSADRDQKHIVDNMDHVKVTLKAALLLMPVLGVPWILGFLAGTSVGFMYATAILNGLQGFFLFFIYIALSKEVRMNVKVKFSRSSLGTKLESRSEVSRYTSTTRPGTEESQLA